MVGPKVCEVIKQFFRVGVLPEEVNETIVSLIPKADRPEEVGQF